MTDVPKGQPKGRANRRHRKAPIRINAFGVRGLDTTVIASKEHASADLGDEAAPLNHKDGLYYEVDPVGARIRKRTRTPHTVRAIRLLWSATLTAASGTLSSRASSSHGTCSL
jgi:hypothetical protein